MTRPVDPGYGKALIDISFEKRADYRSMPEASVGILPVSTLWRQSKQNALKRVNVHLEPILNTENKKFQRLEWAWSPKKNDGLFDDMYQQINVDEKWINLKGHKNKVYILPDEDSPQPKVKSKWYIQKVMFLCAVARPQLTQLDMPGLMKILISDHLWRTM